MMKKGIFLVIFGVMALCQTLCAKESNKEKEDLRNPFLTPKEEVLFKEGKEISYLNLSAIFYSPSNKYAVIDGRIVKEKDTIDGKKVIKITPEQVYLEDCEGKYVVKLKSIRND